MNIRIYRFLILTNTVFQSDRFSLELPEMMGWYSIELLSGKYHTEYVPIHKKWERRDRRWCVILMRSWLCWRFQRFQRWKVKDAAFLCQHTMGHGETGSGCIGCCCKPSQPQATMVNKQPWGLTTDHTLEGSILLHHWSIISEHWILGTWTETRLNSDLKNVPIKNWPDICRWENEKLYWSLSSQCSPVKT